MGIFSIEPGLVIWTWITFAIVLAILARYAFPVLQENLRRREADIALAADRADEAGKRLHELNETAGTITARARQEADRIIQAARAAAEKSRQEIHEKAAKEAADLLEDARRKIARERETALARLQDELADTVCLAAEKVVGRSYASEQDRAYARELAGSV